jgi:alkanesulfonate monooxygenase SsuD/methylene tetrahydromethanopterin reductase-like flavin-dependent oxidoreductase (luciferase family)
LNENFHNRGRRIEEQLDVLRALWTQEVVDFKGRWHTIDRAGVNPLPVQRPIPLWIGGYDDRVLRRAAFKADGWMPSSPVFNPNDESSKAMLAKLRSYLRESGRNDSDFGIEGWINVAEGTQEDWALALEDWKALGVSHLALNTGMSSGRAERLDRLERFKALI